MPTLPKPRIEDAQVQDRFLDWCEEVLSLNGGKPRSTRELRRAVREYLDEQGWSEDERARRERVKAGITVVANLRGAMKAVAKPKTATIADLQDPDLLEEKNDIVPVSLYSCDFRLIERIRPESIDWIITMFSPASLPGHSTVKG
jgi:hypothetical protein